MRYFYHLCHRFCKLCPLTCYFVILLIVNLVIRRLIYLIPISLQLYLSYYFECNLRQALSELVLWPVVLIAVAIVDPALKGILLLIKF